MTLHIGRWEASVHDLGRARQEVLRRLDDGWLDDTELAQIAARFGGEQEIMACHMLLRSLAKRGWLSRSMQWSARGLIEVIPHFMGRAPRASRDVADQDTTYALSRHCAIVDVEGRFALRPADWLHTVVIDDQRVVGALAHTMGGFTPTAFAASAGLDSRPGTVVLGALVAAGVAVRAGDDDAGPLRYWTSDELRMHARSRAGAHTFPIGGTFRFGKETVAEPLAKAPPAAEQIVALPAASAEPVAGLAASFQAVLESRRSIREHDDLAPIRVDQLGEFLRRTQAMRPSGTAGEQEVGRRPYPSAGRICELETYVLVNRCEGLSAGLYWYESLQHRLRLIAPSGPMAERMLNYARAASASSKHPQVLCVVTSRLSRIAWKYEGLAYSMSLRDAGVLLAHMYLVATALALAPCALGTGDSEAFATLSGVDPLAEPCVAEFMLGSIGDTP